MIDLKNELEIIITNDLSATILNKKIDETYHSVNGALQESNHVFIENGLKKINKNKIKVLEVGLGTGLNAALTLIFSENQNLKISYCAIELNPLKNEIIGKYCSFFDKEIAEKISIISHCEWNKKIEISNNFSIEKIETSIQEFKTETDFTIIYFDAFSPSKQPEMWIPEIFNKMYGMLEKSGILVTYCAKGIVKRNLRNAGFEVKSLPGPPGKREMTIAAKC